MIVDTTNNDVVILDETSTAVYLIDYGKYTHVTSKIIASPSTTQLDGCTMNDVITYIKNKVKYQYDYSNASYSSTSYSNALYSPVAVPLLAAGN
jgi:hypothetical protein